MSGIRKGYDDPEKHWTKLRNEWTRDDRIDWGALGLLAHLTSHQDGFDVALDRLTNGRSSKRHRVMGWIAELEKFGYLERETIRSKGQIKGTTWRLLSPEIPSNADGQHTN